MVFMERREFLLSAVAWLVVRHLPALPVIEDPAAKPPFEDLTYEEMCELGRYGL